MYVLGSISYIWVKYIKIKKLLYFFLALLIVACSGDNPSDSNTSNNNVSYFFEIEFGGETHRVEGVTDGGDLNSFITLGNSCYSYQFQINLAIKDPSLENYISGNYVSLNLILDGPFVGNENKASVLVGFNNSSSYMKDYIQSLGGNGVLQFLEGNSGNYGDPQQGMISNISITDLGTESALWSQPNCDAPVGYTCLGNTVKGSYSNVWYFLDESFGFSIPVPISIEFSAIKYL